MSMQQRQCLILQGDAEWLRQQASHYAAQVAAEQRLWLSDSPQQAQAKPVKQASQSLGREFSLVIFEVQNDFATDAFAAVIGTLKAGGLLLLLLDDTLADSRWLQRFLRISQNFSNAIQFVRQGQPCPQIELKTTSTANTVQATDEQQQAIQAVLKVVHGHRRRPLVISSDRGRGKSALLGMAAAELLKQGKQQIVVTAPGIANVDSLMKHAQLMLPESHHSRGLIDWQQRQLRFIAPDALLEQQPGVDLLIVDEAAAIPAQMLEKMLSAYSRIVFSTTVHGYEGSGRGFVLRFEKHLQQHAPGWHKVTLKQPIRWADDDALEAFSYDALLLNAQPVADELISTATVESCDFELVDREKLVNDEQALRQLFGLMALAHYRTRPSDLQMMLDREDISVAVLRYQQQIVASVWLVDEPPLDDALAQAVFDGERRLKGQLLPQSLLVHAGLADAGTLHYQRIIRIAVHPALQGKGLGTALLQAVQQQFQDRCDVIGTSFAMDAKLVNFWQQSGFVAARLGHHADQVSGSQSLLMLKAVSEAGQKLVEQANSRLQADWPLLLSRSLKKLPVELVTLISTALYNSETAVNERVLHEVNSFAQHQRPFESVEIVLWQWLTNRVGSAAFNQLSQQQQSILIKLVLQQHDVQTVARESGLTGRTQLIQLCRESVALTLQCKSS